MVNGRLEITAYDDKGDFQMWGMKMKALMSHHKCLIGLQEKADKWSEDQKKRKGEIDEEAFNLIILSLSDSIIMKVNDCKTPTELWKKLEELFANQMTPNLAYLRATLHAFNDENLDEFLKIIILLNNPKETIDETSKVMILMNSLPESYQVVKDQGCKNR
ncbi:unnamed protein product [Rhodiola kirilowii]